MPAEGAPRVNPLHLIPLVDAGSDGLSPQQFGAIASAPADGRQRVRHAGAMASRRMAVAENETILVCTGGDEPIALDEAAEVVAPPGGMANKIHVWDWSVSDKSRVIDVNVERAFAVSPGGKVLVTHDARVIDLLSGAWHKLDGFDGDVRGMRFSPGAETLLLQVHRGSDSGVARIVELATGKKVCEIEGVWPHTFAAAFSADGKQVLLMGADRVVRRYDAASGKELARYEPALDNSVRTIVWSKDGKLVAAAGTRGEIYLWKIEGGKPLHRLVAHQKPDPESLRRVVGMEFSNDGQVLAGGGIQNLVLWDTGTGQVKRIYPASSGQAAHIRFSADGKSITAVHDFYGTQDRKTGGDALVYPRVQTWDLE
jgi:WD40 repeat protein